jgi:hypothetical protein
VPFSAKQVKTFQAIAKGFKPQKGSLSKISKGQAAKMASEGVKRSVGVARRRHVVGRRLRRRRRA